MSKLILRPSDRLFRPDIPAAVGCPPVISHKPAHELVLFRDSEPVKFRDSEPIKWIGFGRLRVGPRMFVTAENLRFPYSWPRYGKYIVRMDMKKKKRKIPCLRFWHDYTKRILIHDAYDDDPEELEGCISPGLRRDSDKIAFAAQAMAQLISCLGGFVPGTDKVPEAVFPLRIINNFRTGYHDGLNASEWLRLRIRKGYPP